MRVFVAGAAGAIGRQLISLLVGAGHDVTGTTRSTERAEWLASAGARPIIVDAYDRDALRAALADARPDVVVHELTDLARGFDAENLASSGRLREVGTRNLVDAAVAAGAGRLVAQSGAWLYADGPLPHDESHPLRNPTDSPDVRGIVELERVVMGTPGIDGIVLRYGFFYGPNTAFRAENAPEPHVSVEAAARATAAAVERGPAGIYNVVDDNNAITNARARNLLGWQP
jgi:nucleoside-diphosphate-sugar epimerase